MRRTRQRRVERRRFWIGPDFSTIEFRQEYVSARTQSHSVSRTLSDDSAVHEIRFQRAYTLSSDTAAKREGEREMREREGERERERERFVRGETVCGFA